MSLHGSIDVNGHPIGWWAAQRVGTGADGLHTYWWEVKVGPEEWSGRLTHQYEDGALVLAQKVLAAAHEAMAGPFPASPEVATVVQMYADALARMKPEWQVLREASAKVRAVFPGGLHNASPLDLVLRQMETDADRLESEAKGLG